MTPSFPSPNPHPTPQTKKKKQKKKKKKKKKTTTTTKKQKNLLIANTQKISTVPNPTPLRFPKKQMVNSEI